MKVDMSVNAVSTKNYEVNSATAKTEVKKVEKPENEPKEVRVDLSEKDKKKIKAEVDAANKKLENSDTSIRFKVHESEYSENNKISIAVVDKESEKVIREIPSEESIEFAEKMQEITGILFDQKK